MSVGLLDVMEGILETRVWYDDADDRTIVERVQSDESLNAIVKNARFRESTFDHSTYLRSDMVLAATVPTVFIEKWMREYGIDPFNPDDAPKWIRLINDPEFSDFKTIPGKL